MARMYEYVVVQMPSAPEKSREVAWTERINSVAQHGWRFVQMASGPMSITYATFERPVASTDE